MFHDWGNCTDQGVATISCLLVVFQNVVNALLAFVGTFAVFLLIYSGFKYMNSAGDSKKLEDARSALIYALVGLGIVIFSFLIIQIISIVTGVECIKSFGFSC